MINKMKIYTYSQACKIARREGKPLSKLFSPINVPSKIHPGWVKNENT